MANILIVEDEGIVGMNAEMFLTSMGHNVVGCADSEQEALKRIEHEKPDLILMDIVLKGKRDGIELTKVLNEKYNIPVIYISANLDENTITKLNKTKHYGLLAKPFELPVLQEMINNALKAIIS